jgi:hypothetical protein
VLGISAHKGVPGRYRRQESTDLLHPVRPVGRGVAGSVLPFATHNPYMPAAIERRAGDRQNLLNICNAVRVVAVTPAADAMAPLIGVAATSHAQPACGDLCCVFGDAPHGQDAP